MPVGLWMLCGLRNGGEFDPLLIALLKSEMLVPGSFTDSNKNMVLRFFHLLCRSLEDATSVMGLRILKTDGQ